LLRSLRERKNHKATFAKARKSNTHNSVSSIRTKQPLERLHCDLVEPIKPPTLGKQHQYLLVVTDDYTRYMSAKPLRTKDETAYALVEIVNILEKATNPQYNVKFIQADWEVEFHNKDLQTELRQRGIQLKETVTPGNQYQYLLVVVELQPICISKTT